MNPYKKILEFLYQNCEDGKLHDVEHLFKDFGDKQIRKILIDLKNDGLIEFQGGYGIVVAGPSMQDDEEIFPIEEEEETQRKPYKARITYKGIQHVERRNEKSIDMSTINNNNFGPIHNAQIGSYNSQTNYTEIEKQINQAIADSSATSDQKKLMLADMETIKKEADPVKKESKLKKFAADYLPVIGETIAKVVKEYSKS